MYKNHTVRVVIPAYNESKLIGKVIETVPDQVDSIIVVDDCSPDDTSNIVKKYQSNMSGRLRLVEHSVNQNVGGAAVVTALLVAVAITINLLFSQKNYHLPQKRKQLAAATMISLLVILIGPRIQSLSVTGFIIKIGMIILSCDFFFDIDMM